jgi:hypothetical protein
MKSIITFLFQNTNFCPIYKRTTIMPLYLNSSSSSSSSEAGGKNLLLIV